MAVSTWVSNYIPLFNDNIIMCQCPNPDARYCSFLLVMQAPANRKHWNGATINNTKQEYLIPIFHCLLANGILYCMLDSIWTTLDILFGIRVGYTGSYTVIKNVLHIPFACVSIFRDLGLYFNGDTVRCMDTRPKNDWLHEHRNWCN